MWGKPHFTITTIGPYNSGKSTLCARLLYELGGICQREMDKLTKEAEMVGKESCAYAFYMDKTKMERIKGMTIGNTIREFFAYSHHYTLIDAPGHKNFTKNMIKAVSQTDIALLVVPANKDEFEQSMQHLLICHAFGINQIIVCINKMDDESVKYNGDRFNEVKSKLTQLLDALNYDTDRILFIPTDGLTGVNIVYGCASMQWYKGVTLINSLDAMIEQPKELTKESFKMYIYHRFKIRGVGQVVCGRIQQGKIRAGMTVKFLPTGCVGKVFSIEMHHKYIEEGKAGDMVGINIKGLSKDNLPKTGDLMIIDGNDGKDSVLMKDLKYFIGTMFVQYHTGKIKIGYEVSMHIATKRVQCKILSIRWKKGKGINDEMVKYPEYIETGDDAEILFSCNRSLVIYPCDDKYNESLTRIVGLDWNEVIMYGKINDNSYDLYNKSLVYGFVRKFVEKMYNLQIVTDVLDFIVSYV